MTMLKGSDAHHWAGLTRTGAVFTSDELDGMSRQQLVQNLKDSQRGKISNEPQEGSGDPAMTGQPDPTTNAPVGHNLSAQDCKKAINVSTSASSRCDVTAHC